MLLARREGLPGCLSPTFQTEDLTLDALVSQILPCIPKPITSASETKIQRQTSTSKLHRLHSPHIIHNCTIALYTIESIYTRNYLSTLLQLLLRITHRTNEFENTNPYTLETIYIHLCIYSFVLHIEPMNLKTQNINITKGWGENLTIQLHAKRLVKSLHPPMIKHSILLF